MACYYSPCCCPCFQGPQRPYQRGCIGCMARVPCASLLSWICVFAGTACFAASSLIGVRRARDTLNMPDVIPWFDLAVIITGGVTLFVACLCLLVNHISSGETSRHILKTITRNHTAACFTVLVLVLELFFLLAWLLIFTAVAIATYVATTTIVLPEDYNNLRCIDLRHYAFGSDTSKIFCAEGENYFGNNTLPTTTPYPLETFRTKGMQAYYCLLVCITGSFLTLLGLLSFLVCSAGNYKHLKEIKSYTYQDYVEDGAGGQMLDTKL